MLDANFWQDKANSQKIIKEKKFLDDLVNTYKDSADELKDLNDLYHLAVDENNLNVKNDIFENIKALGFSESKYNLIVLLCSE